VAEDLKRTNLYPWHVAHGGRMVPFAGWEMPLRYDTGALEEHRLVRRSAGLFDIDHMGQITVAGPDALGFLNRLVTWDLTTLAVGESHYALMCQPDGGIVDDVFVYRKPGSWFVVVNASNLAKDFAWMQSQAAGFDVVVTDVSAETYMVALQGPRALEIASAAFDAGFVVPERFSAVDTQLAGIPVTFGRTGYTGEDGGELFFPADAALTVWETLLRVGTGQGIEVKPIGLAARDSLRFEPGFPLYGHEIDDQTTPLEANLGWACRLDHEFIGREVLVRQKAEGLRKKLVGFELTEPGVPRQGCTVTTPDGRVVGQVVEGLYAPTADKYCGHAFVEPGSATVGTPLAVVIRDKPKTAVVVRRPFYQPAYRA